MSSLHSLLFSSPWFPSFCCINHTTPLGVISKLLRVHSVPSSMSLIKMLKSTNPKRDPWGTSLAISLYLDTEPLTLAATFQPIPYLQNSPPFKSIPLQCRDKDLVGDHVKGLAQVQVDDTSCLYFVHQCCHSITEGHQVGQTRPSLGEAVLAVSDHLLIPHVPRYVFQGVLFHDFLRHKREAHQLVVP